MLINECNNIDSVMVCSMLPNFESIISTDSITES